jgi:DnaJ-class molecular chaperone
MKDYYGMLGIPRDESSGGIRAAHRDLARVPLPALFAEEAISGLPEAIAVLADAARRRVYDDRLTRLGADAMPPRSDPRETSRAGVEADSVMSDPHSVHPSFEALYDRILRNFTGLDVPKGERAESLTVEVFLDCEDAAMGCLLPIGIPVIRYRGASGGMSTDSGSPALQRSGSYLTEQTRTLTIEVPPHLASGTTFERSLEDFGISNLYLRTRILITH